MTQRACSIAILISLTAATLAARGQTPAAPDFDRDVRPILARCTPCHGPEKQKGGLRLDRRGDALRGGDSGAVLVPGKSGDSLLLRRVGSQDKDERMPPNGEPLSPSQIAILRTWIDAGARWPEATAIADAPPWSFRSIVRPRQPAVKNTTWPRNAIDAFVLARLERTGAAPAPEADRRTLLRRLKFDLLGLPPTPEEIDAFLADRRLDAYERRVDEYLASPHFGERWARHWLDVVRFAESHGFEMNQPRPNAWPYRDYVIRSFNEDKPYDRYVREQIAGDVLGADEATGFLVGGPWDQVKSPDIVLTLNQRADELHDMVSTVGGAFLGLTVGCARCHNHKFDPVTQKDYYAVVACLADVQHGERRIDRPGERRERPEELRRQLLAVAQELEAVEPQAQPQGPAGRRLPVNPRKNVERFPPVRARFVRFTALATNSAEPCLDELEVFTTGSAPRNVALASAGAQATSSGNFTAAPALHRLEHVNDGLYGNPRSWISNEVGRGWVQIEWKEPAVIDRIVWGRDREGRFTDRLAIRYRVEVADEPGAWQLVASSDDRLPFGVAAPSLPPSLDDTGRAVYQRLAAQKAELERRLSEAEKGTMVYAGKFTTPEPTFRLHRGDPTQKREPVAPGALAAVQPPLTLAASAPGPERRLALANWVAHRDNPLTPRVIVNRLWQHHFGRGIVATPSDFGRNGAAPSDPELLDWLATELTANDWRLKHLHRLMVTSAAYRQQRTVPHRLEAEPLRDAILFISGQLDRRMGGPGFDLFEPNTNYVKVYTPKQEFGPAEYRRMIYQSKPRMQLDDTFGVFDCPDAGQATAKRNSSTTPLQALNLLNGRFLLQQAGFLAERLRREAGSDPAAQVRRGFRLAFGRDPDAEESAAAVRLVQAHGLHAFCRALLNANEMVYVY